MNNQSKLRDIQDFAKALDSKLFLEFGSEGVPKLINGGNLFLGTHYAESDKVFMTYNPGKSKRNNCTFNTCLSPCDRYWDYLEGEDYRFWKNSRLFFNSQPFLKSWIGDATSTFLIPWRTNNIAALEKAPVKQRVYEYSGRILRRMLEHHQAKILIVSGVTTLKCLASEQFLDFDLKQNIDQSESLNLGPNYQCRKVIPNRNYEELTIFQIPHFSRANSKKLLPQCSSWAWNEVLKLQN